MSSISPSSSSSPPHPLPPALVDWAWDLCHDLCGGGARLRAHGDHKQLPHSDKVMNHKIKNAWHRLARSMFSFTGRWLALQWHWDRLQCCNNTQAGGPNELHALKNLSRREHIVTFVLITIRKVFLFYWLSSFLNISLFLCWHFLKSFFRQHCRKDSRFLWINYVSQIHIFESLSL